MNENLQPVADEHLEARITAYILGEASAFEAAEIEDLISKSPELRLFATRTRTLNELLKEAETTSNSPDSEWKLSGQRRIALAPVLGTGPVLIPNNESRIRRASFRAAWGIAAILILTFFTKRFLIIPASVQKETAFVVSYSAPTPPERQGALPAAKEAADLQSDDSIQIGGQVRTPGSQQFKEGLTLGEAVASAGATEFGSTKRVKVYRDGKTQTYDLTQERMAQIELQPNDTIEVPQKNWIGCGASRDELAQVERVPKAPSSSMTQAIAASAASPSAIPVPEVNIPAPSADFGEGDDFGSGWGGVGGGFAKAKGSDESLANNAPPAPPQTRGNVTEGNRSSDKPVDPKSIDAIPNNPAPTAGESDEMRELKALRNELADSPDGLSHEFKGSAKQDRIETMDGIVKSGNGALGLEPGNAPSEGEADPFAEAGAVSGLAQREVIRRQEAVVEADRNLLGGRNAYADGDYDQAVDKYKKALQQLPETPATEERRRSYTQHLNDASLARAQELRKIGKYDEARELLRQAETAAPADARIKQEIAYLDDPIRTSPALTYEHQKSVDEVRRKLYMAEGNYELGKYDDAQKTYEDILRIDPYSKAARRGMEKLAAAKSDYYRAAYDHTRSELLAEVDKDWELGIPADRQETVEGKPKEGADLFADSDAPAEITNLSELFSKGNTAQWDGRLDASSDTDFKSDLRAGSERADLGEAAQGGFKMDLADHVTGFTGEAEFDGFVNYGAPIAGEPKQVDITTKHVEIAQANDKELGFDWTLSPFKDTSVITKSGAAANLEVIREFTYPTEFEAPELPATDAVPSATPTDFDSRRTGTEGEILPLMEDHPIVGRLLAKQQPIDLADLSQEIPAAQEPFSTFSLNISDASFQLAASAVEKGGRPDPASIKPEQFYNAVDYGDPAPSSLEPVAAAIDQTAHPVIPGRNLVRVAIRTASTGRSAAQPLRLTLLVDQSGSMARADRRAAMDTALAQLATLLTENDRITVIGFSRTPRLIADSLPGNEAAKIPALVNPTASEGGTNLEQALQLSSELALRHQLDGAQNRIVLFTDGAANLGDADPDRLAARVKELRQHGLAFDIAGIGTNDTNDRLLSELARHGNGRYYLVGENAGASFAAQLAGAFRPAAENVKIQVKLNPERVGSYKLIGFEKDRLKTEDFHDDSVDAAELAADEAGVAIYQVETLPEGTGEIGEVSVRFRDTASGEMVERAWTIPHDPSTPAFDKADPKTQLATLALLAAQKLQGGPLADAIRFADHAETIAKLKQTYANDAKAQRLLTLVNALR